MTTTRRQYERTACPLCDSTALHQTPHGWTCANCDFLAAPFDASDPSDPSETAPLNFAEQLGREYDRRRHAEADTIARRGMRS